jgi:hypothetical protein
MTEEDPKNIWEQFLGTDPSTLALPDYYSNYFAYSFERKGDTQYVALRITGEFAYARYMSYNVYDAKDSSSYGALTDFQISPLPGNVNPFLPGSDAKATKRAYTVYVVPATDPPSMQKNLLPFDSAATKVLTTIIRYYVPEGNEKGNVPLPEVQAFDVRTQRDVPLPTPYPLRGNTDKDVFKRRLAPIFKTVVDDTLRFYRASGAGQFDNADNIYLINGVTQGEGDVLVIRIKPPSYPRNNNEYGTTDVRYWSFNEGDADTSTPFGMKDEQFKAAKDGFIYIAIGHVSIQTTAEERGYNFMPWEADRAKTVILYRNMLSDPQSPGYLMKVPEIVVPDIFKPQNIYSKDAKNYIGDYAPTGQKISQAQFMNGSGGVKSPGF